jgi:hypothetical protein
LRDLDKATRNHPYYQALFDVEVKNDRPNALHLRDVQTLGWSDDPRAATSRIERI